MMAEAAADGQKPKSNWHRSEKQFSVQDIESGSIPVSNGGQDALLLNDPFLHR